MKFPNLSFNKSNLQIFQRKQGFANIQGYEDVKDIIERALDSEENYNLLLVGKPASSKTLFLMGIQEIRKDAIYFDCSNTEGIIARIGLTIYLDISIIQQKLRMIKKLRTIALGTVVIVAVIALFTTGPEVATHQAQAAKTLTPEEAKANLTCGKDLSPTGSAGSVPFSGNAVLLHCSSPFTVTYTVNAVAQPTKTVNNIQEAMNESAHSK